jgi:hypothetical protein
MKISLDNALLWIIPYLYVVSIAYYWGFWGALGIDAFNYYQVSDLVKGVTSPLATTLAWIGAFGLFMIVWDRIMSAILERNLTLFVIVSIVLFLCIGFGYYWSWRLVISTIPAAGSELKWHSSWILTGAFILTRYLDNNLPKTFLEGRLRTIVILFFVMLPCQAHLDGRNKSLFIREGQEFDYVVADSLAGPKSVYKFLGKAGEYYFLSTLDNQKRIITPAEKMSPLVIEHYLKTDSASIKRFLVTEKSLEPAR